MLVVVLKEEIIILLVLLTISREKDVSFKYVFPHILDILCSRR